MEKPLVSPFKNGLARESASATKMLLQNHHFPSEKDEHDGYTKGIPWIDHVSDTHPTSKPTGSQCQRPQSSSAGPRKSRALPLPLPDQGDVPRCLPSGMKWDAEWFGHQNSMIRKPKPVAEPDFMQVGSQKIQEMDGKCCKKISKQHVFCGKNWDATTCDKVVFGVRSPLGGEAVYN